MSFCFTIIYVIFLQFNYHVTYPRVLTIPYIVPTQIFSFFFYDNNCFRLNRRLRKYCLLSCVRDVFSECIFTLAIASVLQSIGYWAFFPGNNFVHRTHWTHLTGGTLFHNELKICSAPCRLSLVLMNTPGTAKVLGSNLTKTSFFSKGNCSGSKKFPPNIYLLVLLA